MRQIHSVLSGALGRAVRWGWLGVNPADHATPPALPTPNPEPPTAEQAARIVTEAWRDPDWGMLVWLALVTGARRGELCALTWEKETKAYQQRRVTLDDQTLALLQAYRRRRAEQAAGSIG